MLSFLELFKPLKIIKGRFELLIINYLIGLPGNKNHRSSILHNFDIPIMISTLHKKNHGVNIAFSKNFPISTIKSFDGTLNADE